jgi:predicted dehydrogenase
MSRRRFLSASCAGAAFAIVKPGQVRGTQANSKIKAGFIGLGGRGAWITNHAKNNGGYEISAVADYFENVSRQVGKKYGVAKDRCFSGLSGYKRLLDAKVEAVFLKTPPYCFPDHASAAVDAGCHVYIAKPVAVDIPGTKAIENAAAKAGESKKVFLVDFQTRTDPLIVEGIKRMHEGQIGKLCMVNSLYADEGFRDPPRTKTIESRLRSLIWVNDLNLGGGMLVNAGIHMVDVALWMAGERLPKSATGSGTVGKANPNGDTLYLYSINYEFEDGLVVHHRGDHLKNRTGFNTECIGYCQDGYLETHYHGGWIRMLGNKAGWRGGEIKGLYGRGAQSNIATFRKSITDGKCDNPTVKPSLNANYATILGREAARRKRRVTMEELVKENKKLEVDFSGMKD